MSPVKTLKTDILIVGSGAAGMAAAAAASDFGVSATVADDRNAPGGVLNQCVHSGFGLGRYGKEMTGPEYSGEEFRRFADSSAVYLPGCRVLSLAADRTALVSNAEGLCRFSFDECILATGCTERSLWSLSAAGTRPEGIHTAGEAQEMIELGGYDTGSRIFILGSGDIGQIMARRFVQLGKTVVCMAEQNGHIGGMKRNQDECIRAYDIPVILNSTVTEVHGFPHITGVTLHHIDSGIDELIECDTLITALGLEPDKTLAEDLKTADGYPRWLHFCGNADFVHEIADSASAQGEKLGITVAGRILNKRKEV
ncbi:MAG: NAD(P)/FAD-dependent oxidoreductase [Mogibacterium sp.]|nr:NAD(P)/FAD-dependent oxidoreductase [Mogibacterium sp.]